MSSEDSHRTSPSDSILSSTDVKLPRIAKSSSSLSSSIATSVIAMFAFDGKSITSA